MAFTEVSTVPADIPAGIAVSVQHDGVVPSSPSTGPVTPPIAIPTWVTVLLQEDTKAPSSVPVVSTTGVASTPPGADALEDDAPGAVEEDVPAAGEVAEDAQVAEDPTSAAVQAQGLDIVSGMTDEEIDFFFNPERSMVSSGAGSN